MVHIAEWNLIVFLGCPLMSDLNNLLFTGLFVNDLRSKYTIEKPLEMPFWNLLCLRRIGLSVYIFSVSKNKITQPHTDKFDGLLTKRSIFSPKRFLHDYRRLKYK